MESEIAEAIEYIKQIRTEDSTKIEMNKSYDYSDGLSIKFTGITIDDTYLCLNVQFSNSSSETLEIGEVYSNLDYVEGTNISVSGGDRGWRGIYSSTVDDVPPNETIDAKMELNASYLTNGEYTACCYMSFLLNGEWYYIDLVEWAK